jgi:molybdate transport system substrate-binding protein
MKQATCAAAIAAGFAVFSLPAAAQSTPLRARQEPIAESSLRVFASNGVKAVIEQLQPEYERATGRRLATQFGSTTDLVNKINAGEAFDLTMLTSEAIDQLIKAGKVVPKATPLARCGVGVGIRTGAPKPEIGTPEAMKHTLLKAKSVTYAEDGASRVFVEKMEERLGITSEVKAKTMLTHGSGAATANVADGKADLVLTLASEILPVHGIELAGPLPEALQGYVNFAAGVAVDTRDPAAANAVIQFFKGPSAAPVYRAKGMEAR